MRLLTGWNRIVCLIVLCTAVAVLHADVEPSTMFGNSMVLQRGMPVPVWGKADPGETVTVRFAGQSKSTKAAEDGKWMIELDSLEASATGRQLAVAGLNRVVFDDVLVGEVWICSGQSNMQMGYRSVPELAELVSAARAKPIRTYNVTTYVSFAPEENCRGEWSVEPASSAVAFGFSYHLQEALGVPVAVILTRWGSSCIEGWMPLDMADQLPHFRKMMEEFETKHRSRTAELIRQAENSPKGPRCWPRDDNIFLRTRPNILYNAMLHPVAPYAARGMVWYQGEANSGRPEQYAESLRLWVERLRKLWGQPDFHFLAVMLPGFGRIFGEANRDLEYPDNFSWAWFREAQMKVLDLPFTAVANTIDLGEKENIHPKDKGPICERLALIARCDVNGEEVLSRGPVFAGSEVAGSEFTVSFKYADGLRTEDGRSPRGFWLAGEDRAWHEAEASIKGKRVVLRSANVSEPVACRYAFAAMPEVNLVNRAGLPAYPFRTDDWSLPK